MTKEQLIWLYEYILKHTKEKAIAGFKNLCEKSMRREINKLLFKYDCETL